MGEPRDFDAAFAEMRGEPIRLTLFGEQWEIEREAPAVAVLEAYRLKRAGGSDSEASMEVLVQAAKAFLGEPVVDAWLARGITLTQLDQVIRWVAEERTGRPEADAPGEPEPALPAST